MFPTLTKLSLYVNILMLGLQSTFKSFLTPYWVKKQSPSSNYIFYK